VTSQLSYTISGLVNGDTTAGFSVPAYNFAGVDGTVYPAGGSGATTTVPTAIGSYEIGFVGNTITTPANYTLASNGITKGKLVIAACAGGTCAVGDVGPGGGLIIYVDTVGKRYVEAAPATWNGGTSSPRASWGCSNQNVGNSLLTEFFDGKIATDNGRLCTASNGVAGAPKLAYDKSPSWSSSVRWILPSRRDLIEMLTVALTNANFKTCATCTDNKLGISAANGYWSSTESSANPSKDAVQVTWNTNNVAAVAGTSGKTNSNFVHPVLYWDFAGNLG
jgi:hypothetical protein